MRRTGAGLLAVTLAACSGGGESKADQPAGSTTNSARQQPDNRIRCALGGAADFAPACTRDTGAGPDGETWIIRHPDGGFRRFVLIDGGKRIATADGAEEVRAKRVGSDLEVQVGADRYLFPAAPEPHASAT